MEVRNSFFEVQPDASNFEIDRSPTAPGREIVIFQRNAKVRPPSRKLKVIKPIEEQKLLSAVTALKPYIHSLGELNGKNFQLLADKFEELEKLLISQKELTVKIHLSKIISEMVEENVLIKLVYLFELMLTHRSKKNAEFWAVCVSDDLHSEPIKEKLIEFFPLCKSDAFPSIVLLFKLARTLLILKHGDLERKDNSIPNFGLIQDYQLSLLINFVKATIQESLENGLTELAIKIIHKLPKNTWSTAEIREFITQLTDNGLFKEAFEILGMDDSKSYDGDFITKVFEKTFYNLNFDSRKDVNAFANIYQKWKPLINKGFLEEKFAFLRNKENFTGALALIKIFPLGQQCLFFLEIFKLMTKKEDLIAAFSLLPSLDKEHLVKAIELLKIDLITKAKKILSQVNDPKVRIAVGINLCSIFYDLNNFTDLKKFIITEFTPGERLKILIILITNAAKRNNKEKMEFFLKGIPDGGICKKIKKETRFNAELSLSEGKKSPPFTKPKVKRFENCVTRLPLKALKRLGIAASHFFWEKTKKREANYFMTTATEEKYDRGILEKIFANTDLNDKAEIEDFAKCFAGLGRLTKQFLLNKFESLKKEERIEEARNLIPVLANEHRSSAALQLFQQLREKNNIEQAINMLPLLNAADREQAVDSLDIEILWRPEVIVLWASDICMRKAVGLLAYAKKYREELNNQVKLIAEKLVFASNEFLLENERVAILAELAKIAGAREQWDDMKT